MRITIWYAAQKGKNRLYWWHVTRRGPISGRHIFFKSKRMPKHNIDCPSKEETGNRKQTSRCNLYDLPPYKQNDKMVARSALPSMHSDKLSKKLEASVTCNSRVTHSEYQECIKLTSYFLFSRCQFNNMNHLKTYYHNSFRYTCP